MGEQQQRYYLDGGIKLINRCSSNKKPSGDDHESNFHIYRDVNAHPAQRGIRVNESGRVCKLVCGGSNKA